MVVLVNCDVRHPVQDALDRDAALDPGKRSARAGVDSAGKGHVLAHVLAAQVELVRVLEPARIPVGGTRQQHHDGAWGDVDATHCGGLARQPAVALDGAVHAQRFFDEPGDQAAVLTQLLLYVGAVADHLQRGAEQLGRGLLSGGEEEGRRAGDFDDLGCGSVRIFRRRQ